MMMMMLLIAMKLPLRHVVLPSISYGPSLAESPVEHGGCDPELEPETAVENNVTVSASE